jgi:hypothetical protein
MLPITLTPLTIGMGLIMLILAAAFLIIGPLLRSMTLSEGAYGEVYTWKPLPKRRSDGDGGGSDGIDTCGDGDSGDGGD